MPKPVKIFRWLTGSRFGRLSLVVLTITLCVHLWLTWRIHGFVDHFCRATMEGSTLSHPDVVLVYDHLLGPLKDELKNGYRISTRPYDAFEFDFPKCTHSAFVKTTTHQIGLRLRIDPFRNQFHVVGYWTVK